MSIEGKTVEIIQNDRRNGQIGVVDMVNESGLSARVLFEDGKTSWYSTRFGIKVVA